MSPGASPDPVDLPRALASPLFDAVRPWLARLASLPPTLDELNDLGTPVRFVPAPQPGTPRLARSSAVEPYEAHIERTGEVPTREGNWHDAFNALAWAAFPKTKAVLNRRHAEQIRLRGASGPRGTARDVLSLFDEGGVIVTSTDASLLAMIREFQWRALFWERREDVLATMRFHVFGHAILEKALEPYKAVTAKALLLAVPADSPAGSGDIDDADDRAAHWFASSPLDSTRSLAPLPVLGIPGWADNGHAAFYEDPVVFRSGYRRGRASVPGA